MMKICCDFGHGTGEDRGADGYVNEERVIREYGPLVIAGLQKLGHTVYNVTPTQAGLTLIQSLAYRVNMSNSLRPDLFLCLHVNSYIKDKAEGCEVEYFSALGKAYSDKICLEISKLGFVNRGSKPRPNLYVLKYTSAVAVLVEPFFCDSKSDCNKYDAKKLANAIIKGITQKDVYLGAPVAAPQPGQVAAPQPGTVVVPKVFDNSIPVGTNITPFNGCIGYIETFKDSGRVIVHLDRSTYISMQNESQESHIDLYTRQVNKRLL